MKRLFERRYEDFDCTNCGSHITGNGYTDHCPNCLYSKHVDINPGDRSCDCHGTMKPVKATFDRFGTYTLEYICIKCKTKKRFKALPNDNLDAISKLI